MLGVFLGFFQENIKVSLNSSILSAQAVVGFDQMTLAERNLKIESDKTTVVYDYAKNNKNWVNWYRFELGQMKQLKWVITLVFVVVFFCLNALCIRFSGVDSLYTLILIYLVLFILALLTYLVGLMLEVDFYAFSRRVVGALQSVLPSSLLILASFLNKK